jgi:hypothetical protein
MQDSTKLCILPTRLYWRFYRNTVAGSFKSLLQCCDRISNTIYSVAEYSGLYTKDTLWSRYKRFCQESWYPSSIRVLGANDTRLQRGTCESKHRKNQRYKANKRDLYIHDGCLRKKGIYWQTRTHFQIATAPVRTIFIHFLIDQGFRYSTRLSII